MATIANGKNTPVNVDTGTVPSVGGAMRDWFQPMVFVLVTKQTIDFQEVELGTPICFWGVVQPLTDRELFIRPEGERAWSWLQLHADPVLTLKVDDCVIYLNVQYRVVGRRNYKNYGYVEYSLVQDYDNAGPSLIPYDINGGNAFSTYCFSIDGGNAFTTTFKEPDINGGGAAA